MMIESFFKIIIPNYNNAEWIGKCLNSILSQTFKDYSVVVIDDLSTDDSTKVVESYFDKDIHIHQIVSPIKVFNGGARNIGIKEANIKSKYTLFIDSDDWFMNDKCLQDIYDTIIENNYPDCVSLSYNCLIGENLSYQQLIRNNPKELVDSLYVACWTKCIKTELIQLFPENTLMEDVVQHIKQCDVLKTIVSIDKPIVCWNRNNVNSCSRVENQDCQKGKWQSSMFRYCADLMDLQCNTEYCEEHRNWRLGIVMSNIKDGKYIQ